MKAFSLRGGREGGGWGSTRQSKVRGALDVTDKSPPAHKGHIRAGYGSCWPTLCSALISVLLPGVPNKQQLGIPPFLPRAQKHLHLPTNLGERQTGLPSEPLMCLWFHAYMCLGPGRLGLKSIASKSNKFDYLGPSLATPSVGWEAILHICEEHVSCSKANSWSGPLAQARSASHYILLGGCADKGYAAPFLFPATVTPLTSILSFCSDYFII